MVMRQDRRRRRLWALGAALSALASMHCNYVFGIPDAEMGPVAEDDLSARGAFPWALAPATPTPCSSDEQCSSDDWCQVPSCQAGVCTATPLDGIALPSEEQEVDDCSILHCVKGVSTAFADDTDVVPDGLECTVDECFAGMSLHTPLPSGTACRSDGGTFCYKDQCVQCIDDSSCTDPYETCGGAGSAYQCGCTPSTCVDAGLTCGVAGDGCGGTLDCNDGFTEPGETDSDCGGNVANCPTRCDLGQNCTTATDCNSGACDAVSELCVGGQWALGFGGDVGSSLITHAITTDSELNVIIVGELTGEVVIDGLTLASSGGRDAFVVKFDSTGALVWMEAFGDAGEQIAYDVAVDSLDDVLVVGSFQGTMTFNGSVASPISSSDQQDAFVAKLAADYGDGKWASAFGAGGDQIAHSVAVTAQSHVVVAGQNDGPISFGGDTFVPLGASANGFVAMLDVQGDHVWSHPIHSSDELSASEVAVAPDDHIYVAGTLHSDLTFGAKTLYGDQGGASGIFVVRLEPVAGSDQWFDIFSDTKDITMSALAVDSNSHAIVGGEFTGQLFMKTLLTKPNGADSAVFVARLDDGGAVTWNKQSGCSGAQVVHDLAVDHDDNLIVAGSFTTSFIFGGAYGSMTAEEDAFFVKLDAGGSTLLADVVMLDDPGSQRGKAIAVDAWNQPVLAGTMSGAATTVGSVPVGPFEAQQSLFIARPPP